jgi:hypothetical protein
MTIAHVREVKGARRNRALRPGPTIRGSYCHSRRKGVTLYLRLRNSQARTGTKSITWERGSAVGEERLPPALPPAIPRHCHSRGTRKAARKLEREPGIMSRGCGRRGGGWGVRWGRRRNPEPLPSHPDYTYNYTFLQTNKCINEGSRREDYREDALPVSLGASPVDAPPRGTRRTTSSRRSTSDCGNSLVEFLRLGEVGPSALLFYSSPLPTSSTSIGINSSYFAVLCDIR